MAIKVGLLTSTGVEDSCFTICQEMGLALTVILLVTTLHWFSLQNILAAWLNIGDSAQHFC